MDNSIFIKIIIVLLAMVGSQFIMRWIISYLCKKIDKSINRIYEIYESIEKNPNKETRAGAKLGKYNFDDFFKEITAIFLVKQKKRELNFITTIIGAAEILIFAGLTILVIKTPNLDILEGVNEVGKFSGAWIALKIIGGYRPWTGAVFGRAYFYVFLIGSILNIMFAIIIGWFISTII